ncbi:MAG: NAD(P)H-dependent oxidoreductase [Ginsengibacter sp.]
MYLIISGTNRDGSHTEKVAQEYQRLLNERNIEAKLFSLMSFDPLIRDAAFIKIEKEILQPADKIIFITPEYNGSYPGVLKSLIDNSDIRNTWYFKKALLTGVSSGRAGNLRGMDHLSDVLHYLKMNVHFNKLPISSVNKIMDEIGKLDAGTVKAINQQLDEFILF